MAQRGGGYTRAGTSLPRVSATFTPTPRARELLSTLPSVVVLRAPRGFGKSSTAAEWLRRPDLPDHDVVWVTLPPQPATGATFWRAVDAAVERAGLGEALAADGWEGVAQVAQARRRRLVLAVDGYDRVRDPQVDEELVALVHAHEELHLALLMRVSRPVEALARVVMDTVVLTREDLALDAAQVVELARATGRPVTEDEAVRLSEDLGGWPGLLRAALLTASRGPGGDLVLDTGGLADYLRLVLQDDELAGTGEDLTALAVPETVTDEVAAHLVGPHVLAEALPRARAAGLVPDGDHSLAYPATVRDLLRRILREDSPTRYRDLNRSMTQHARRSGDFVGALGHAVRTQDPGAVLDVVEDGWNDLVGHPAAVRAALAHVPADLLERSAKGRVARDHLAPAEVPTSFLMAVVSGLRPGAGWEDDGADRLPPPGTDVAEEAELLVRLGTQALLDGDPLRAAHAFADAEVRLAGGDGADPAGGGAEGTAGRARAGASVSMALLGHPAAARRYLAGGTADGALGRVAATLVPSLLALDALTPTEPADDVALPPHLAGLEAIALYVRAGAALHSGAAHEVVGELEQFRHGPAGHFRLAEHLMIAALVDLYLAAGRGDRARALVDGHDNGEESSSWMRAGRARVALYTGEHDLAMELTGDVNQLAALRPRTALKLAVIRAVAAHRAGHRQTAAEALDLAAGLAVGSGNIRAFALVPRGDIEQLAADAPRARQILDRPELAAGAVAQPLPSRPVNLSRSELRVLVELATGRPVTHVARRLFVSESTIKTQVRSIYRKLDVHTRADALSRARALGILPTA
ncbi:LuxR C-terminal-related transcriptional regulator [Georgenia yuyongxinii]|uniref:HTH luxR-type domain-containing protein n=1 Tax=Georgenia yuyongxinii TaxID=2589797 RepID=A0A552WQI4_9MICO|nr:LuxR C-terminal-related transcriptional regulator [Georgenia yuyongxinii]TRW45010.1 hypothetical protein FJ693_11380 [Georgenia yuyongxinii]